MGCSQSRQELDNLILLGNSKDVIKKYAKNCNINGSFITGTMCKNIRVWSYINFDLENIENELKSWKILLTMLKGRNLAILCFEDGKFLSSEMKKYCLIMYKLIDYSDLILLTEKSGVETYETRINHLSDKLFTVWVISEKKNEDFIKFVENV